MIGTKDDFLEKEITLEKTQKASKSKAKLIAKFDIIQNLEVKMQIHGHKMHKTSWCCGSNNNNFLEISKPIESVFNQQSQDKTEGFDANNLQIKESDWILVHRSDAINQNQLCNWDEILDSKSKLASGRDDLPLKIKVMDHRNNGNHKLVGTAMKTLAELKLARERNTHIPIVLEGKERGSLTVEKYDTRSLGC